MSGWLTRRPITNAPIPTHATARGKRRRSASGSITATTVRRMPGLAGSLNAGSCRSSSKVAYTDTSAAADRTAANPASAAVGWRWSVAANRGTRVLMPSTVSEKPGASSAARQIELCRKEEIDPRAT